MEIQPTKARKRRARRRQPYNQAQALFAQISELTDKGQGSLVDLLGLLKISQHTFLSWRKTLTVPPTQLPIVIEWIGDAHQKRLMETHR